MLLRCFVIVGPRNGLQIDYSDQDPRPARRPSARRPLNIQAFMALGEMHQLRRHGGQRGQAGRFPAPAGIFIAKVPEPPAGSPRLLREPTMFRPPGGDDTKFRWDETVFRTGEDIRKPALDTNRPSNEGPQRPMTGDRHNQSSFSRRPWRVCRRRHRRSPRLRAEGRSQCYGAAGQK
jgi:hypothetical protein